VTVFLTTIIAGAMRRENYCPACAEEANPGQTRMEDTLRGGCEYCGAPAVGAGSSSGQLPIATCGECAEASREFMHNALGLDRDASSEEVLSRLKEWSPEAKAEAVRKMAGAEDYIKGRRKWYSADGYSFVHEAFDRAINRRETENASTAENLTAAGMLDAVRLFAIERFGPGARERLRGWGITRCEDVGEIVFRLIAAGVFAATPEDKQEDFSNGYDFELAFPET
jgi:uncharacterized repeat protein (TIGR04138 family)